MSNSNTSKCAHFPSEEGEKNSDSEDASLPAYKNAQFFMLVRSSQGAVEQELHQNRMRELRTKGLQYLEDEAWRYEPIEKYIGQ